MKLATTGAMAGAKTPQQEHVYLRELSVKGICVLYCFLLVFIILFLAVLDLCCFVDFSLVTENRGYSLGVVCGLLLLSMGSRASVVEVCGL